MDDWLTVNQAAAEMGVSPATIRRMVKAGELEAEVIPRRGNQTSFRVRLRHEPNQSASPDDMPPSDDPLQPAPDLARSLDILEALLVANGETMERQVERIAALERENGRLQAQTCHEAERRKALEAELATLKAETARPWWRRILG